MTTVSSEHIFMGDVTYRRNWTACYKPVNSVTSLQTHSRNVTEQKKRSQYTKTAHLSTYCLGLVTWELEGTYGKRIMWVRCLSGKTMGHELLPVQKHLSSTHFMYHGPVSVVGIATGYGLDGPGIESRWERDFPHLSRPALGATQPPVQRVPGLSRG